VPLPSSARGSNDFLAVIKKNPMRFSNKALGPAKAIGIANATIDTLRVRGTCAVYSVI